MGFDQATSHRQTETVPLVCPDSPACQNSSKIRWTLSGSIPIPVSVTESSTVSANSVTSTLIDPPSGVYFTALDSRL